MKLSEYYTVLKESKDVDKIHFSDGLKYRTLITRRNSKGKILWFNGFSVTDYTPNCDNNFNQLTEVSLDEYIVLMQTIDNK